MTLEGERGTAERDDEPLNFRTRDFRSNKGHTDPPTQAVFFPKEP